MELENLPWSPDARWKLASRTWNKNHTSLIQKKVDQRNTAKHRTTKQRRKVLRNSQADQSRSRDAMCCQLNSISSLKHINRKVSNIMNNNYCLKMFKAETMSHRLVQQICLQRKKIRKALLNRKFHPVSGQALIKFMSLQPQLLQNISNEFGRITISLQLLVSWLRDLVKQAVSGSQLCSIRSTFLTSLKMTRSRRI